MFKDAKAPYTLAEEILAPAVKILSKEKIHELVNDLSHDLDKYAEEIISCTEALIQLDDKKELRLEVFCSTNWEKDTMPFKRHHTLEYLLFEHLGFYYARGEGKVFTNQLRAIADNLDAYIAGDKTKAPEGAQM